MKKTTMQEEMEGSPPLIEVFMSPQRASCAQQICKTCYDFLQLQFLKFPLDFLMTSHASLHTHYIKSVILVDCAKVVPNC